jgi:hypothetical protein
MNHKSHLVFSFCDFSASDSLSGYSSVTYADELHKPF